MKPVIFIDGREGTTGLQIEERLAARQDIELIAIDEDKRKDPAERKKFLNAADLVFLCLPDDAAREAVAMIDNPHTRVIDASTAHRTAPGWDYGFPELSPRHREAIVHWPTPAATLRGSSPRCTPWCSWGCSPRTILCAPTPSPATPAGGRSSSPSTRIPTGIPATPRPGSTAPPFTTSTCRRWSTSAA